MMSKKSFTWRMVSSESQIAEKTKGNDVEEMLKLACTMDQVLSMHENSRSLFFFIFFITLIYLCSPSVVVGIVVVVTVDVKGGVVVATRARK